MPLSQQRVTVYTLQRAPPITTKLLPAVRAAPCPGWWDRQMPPRELKWPQDSGCLGNSTLQWRNSNSKYPAQQSGRRLGSGRWVTVSRGWLASGNLAQASTAREEGPFY